MTHISPHRPGLSIIGIGGALGHFLAYFAKHFGYAAFALDYSVIVFSTGFIEHFSNLDIVVGKHVALLKKGGILREKVQTGKDI